MISLTPDQLKARAEAWRDALGQGNVIQSESTVGGGSLPEESLPTFVLSLHVRSANTFLKNLRQGNPPIIARTEKDRILLDPRTVLPGQEDVFLTSLKKELYEI
jgi:L-seryl-tRNA(Ser) seleniumtransferase